MIDFIIETKTEDGDIAYDVVYRVHHTFPDCIKTYWNDDLPKSAKGFIAKAKPRTVTKGNVTHTVYERSDE